MSKKMKVLLTKEIGRFGDPDAVGQVHLTGLVDTTACGLAYEEYEREPTSKPITCSTCLSFLEWAKSVSKIVAK